MYRIVHNEQTRNYRVEKRGILGWAFVTDPQTAGYLNFDNIEAAQAWVREKLQRSNQSRRWKVVAQCNT